MNGPRNLNPRLRWVIGGFILVAAAMAWVRWGGSSRNEPASPASVQRESCVGCHAVRGLGPLHDPSVIGCAICHLGDGKATDKAEAHRGVRVVAGELDIAPSTCGTSGCHFEVTRRVEQSLMAGAPGIVSVNRFAWGERTSPTPTPEDDLRRVSTTTTGDATEHVRKLCGSCHLGAKKDGPGDHGFHARGGGCTACHLSRPDPREDGNNTSRAHLHPSLSARVPDSRCEGCHARSGRISLSYQGKVEVDEGAADAVGKLPDGRPYATREADVHARRGMGCIDCHTERDVMGPHSPTSHAADAVDVSCEDCHGARPKPGQDDPSRNEASARLRGLWQASGREPITGVPLHTNAGTPLWRTDAASRTLRLSETGKTLVIPVAQEGPHHGLAAHSRLTCQSCHTTFAPRCPSCHTRRDADAMQWDHLANRATPGSWVEQGGGFGAGLPVLMVDGRGRIHTFVEGMHGTFDKGSEVVHRKLWSPLDAHTSGRARPCSSCHRKDVDAVAPKGAENTRARARPLSNEERQRLVRVAECIRCHESYRDPIYVDFPRAVSAVQPGTVPKPRSKCTLGR